MKRTPLALSILLLLAALAGCDRSVVIRGDLADPESGLPIPGVVDVKGEALPGVAVTVRNTDVQDVTNTVGQYRLHCPPGYLEVDLLKTGYTSGRLVFEAPSPRVIEAAQAQLWPLPQTWGVFLFEDYRYRETTRTDAHRFEDAEGGVVWGTKIKPGYTTYDTQPLIIAYRMPPYDAKLYRLEQRTGMYTHANGSTYEDTVWLPADATPIYVDFIDETERLLNHLRVPETLDYGVYALHWGALDGYTATDPNIFLFRIADPDAPEETEGEAEGEEAADDEGPTASTGDAPTDEF